MLNISNWEKDIRFHIDENGVYLTVNNRKQNLGKPILPKIISSKKRIEEMKWGYIEYLDVQTEWGNYEFLIDTVLNQKASNHLKRSERRVFRDGTRSFKDTVGKVAAEKYPQEFKKELLDKNWHIIPKEYQVLLKGKDLN